MSENDNYREDYPEEIRGAKAYNRILNVRIMGNAINSEGYHEVIVLNPVGNAELCRNRGYIQPGILYKPGTSLTVYIPKDCGYTYNGEGDLSVSAREIKVEL